MLAFDERRLLYALAREGYEGLGAIVDAGCFLGGSTLSLAQGLRDRSDKLSGSLVHVYDRFSAEQYQINAGFFGDPPHLREGDSFLPMYRANLRGHESSYVLHAGDIAELGWLGEPIEILFLDVLKTWHISDAVLKNFFPHLIPGGSVVVQQDYGDPHAPWIPIAMEHLADYFELVGYLPPTMRIYLATTAIPAETVANFRERIPPEHKLALLDQAIAGATGELRGLLLLAKASQLSVSAFERAFRSTTALLDQVEAEFTTSDYALNRIRDLRGLLELADGIYSGRLNLENGTTFTPPAWERLSPRAPRTVGGLARGAARRVRHALTGKSLRAW